MKTPQVITIVLYALAVGIELAQHGKPREGKHNVIVAAIGAALQIAILWWGGFFG